MLDGCTREFDKHGSLKILETEANTHWKEPSESYIDTIQACKHKMPLYLFRFSVLFTKGHFIIEQCISQNQKRNLLGLRDRFQINVRKSKNYINSLLDNVRPTLFSPILSSACLQSASYSKSEEEKKPTNFLSMFGK